jgi:uncharacterized membrane protein
VKTAPRFFRPHVLAIAILLAALALRLWDFTARSLWLDEAVEYWTATAPLGSLPATVRDVIQDPPLYSFLLHLWMTISTHEAWLRFLSLLFGMGSVVGMMVLGYRLQGWAAALGAGALLAVLPAGIRYSQEVGQYAPMLCFVVWSLVVLVGLVPDPAPRRFARWVVLAVIAAYTYYGTVMPVLVPFVCFILEGAKNRDRVRWWRGLVSLAAIAVAIVPLLVYFLPHQLHRGPTAHAFQAAAIGPFGDLLRDVGNSLKMTFGFQLTGWPCTLAPGWLTVVLFVALLVLAARQQRRLVVWFAATWLVYAALGWLHLFPIGFRHSNILTALIVPVAACAIPTRGSAAYRAGGVAVFAAVGILCLVSLPARSVRERVAKASQCTWPETEDIAKVARYWMEHRTPEQKTYVYYGAAPAFAYYVEALGIEHTSRPADWFGYCWRGEGSPWCASGNIYYGEWLRTMSPEDKVASILTTLGGTPDEFWFVFAHAQEGENVTIGKLLLERYQPVDYLTASDASAVLLRRRASP